MQFGHKPSFASSYDFLVLFIEFSMKNYVESFMGSNLQKSRFSKIRGPGPGAGGQGPGTGDQGPGTRDQGPGTRDQGPGTRDQGPGTRDQGPGTRDQGPGTRDQGSGTRDTKLCFSLRFWGLQFPKP